MITAAIAATRAHSDPVNPVRIRVHRETPTSGSEVVWSGLVWSNDDTLDGGPGQDKHSSCEVVLWTISPVDTYQSERSVARAASVTTAATVVYG